jgi:predicted ATP-dependent endonuclease of OLD family
MEFLDALRDAKSQLSASSKNTVLNKILSIQTENKITELKTALLNLNKIINDNNSPFSSIKNEISDFLKKISIEGENSKIDFDFRGVESSEIIKKISLIYGDTPINVERNGLGRNNLLYISLLLSQLMQIIDNSDKKIFFRLIGIEEPEAHLHPHLQVHLSRNINENKSDERQIIITSHSTHITSQLNLDDTIVLYRDKKDELIKPYYLISDIPEQSKNYLNRYLDATKSTMFFSRKVILVEGISEQLLIPEFFKLFKKEDSLEKHGISIINVGSVAFEHFLRVLKKGYFIKGLVLTDSDNDTNAKHRVTTLERAYSNINHIAIKKTKKTTFEIDLIEANKTGIGKSLLISALRKTRRNLALKYIRELDNKDIEDSYKFFEIIYSKNKHNYKAEFAMNLLYILRLKNKESVRKDFNLPSYIKEGFSHLDG